MTLGKKICAQWDLITLLTSSFPSNIMRYLHTHFIFLKFLKLLLGKEIVNVECCLHLEELETSFPALDAFGSICSPLQNITTKPNLFFYIFLPAQMSSYLEFVHAHDFFFFKYHCFQCVTVFSFFIKGNNQKEVIQMDSIQ